MKTAVLGNFRPPPHPNNSLSPGDHDGTPKKVPHGNTKPGPFNKDRVEFVAPKRADLERESRELQARDSAGEGSSCAEQCDESNRDADQEAEDAGLVVVVLDELLDAVAGGLGFLALGRVSLSVAVLGLDGLLFLLARLEALGGANLGLAGLVALLLGDGGTFLTRGRGGGCLLYTSPSPRDRTRSRMPSSA